ncbi:MAG: hypothetical protein U0Q55_22100 [Vicinamibacterales bacterium]
MVTEPASHEPPPNSRFASFIHRELVLLCVLIAGGAVLFLATRELSASNVALRRRDAEAWHARGRSALERGQTPEALEALGRAAALARDDRGIARSLATALRAAGQDARAAEVLEGLRARVPDDAEVDLELARLEAHRDFSLSTRYYQDTLDGFWAPADAARAREVREEFIALLLSHNQRARALSQVLVLAADLPPEPGWQLRVAGLFLACNDPRRAFARFSLVLRDDPGNRAARIGAGESAFQLDDFATAARLLSDVPDADDRIRELRVVAGRVLDADPLAPRLGRRERIRRQVEMLDRAQARLAMCQPPSPGAAGLASDLQALLKAVPQSGHGATADRDQAEDAVSLAARAERASSGCGEPSPLDQAIAIIARLRGLSEP